jgi:transposase
MVTSIPFITDLLNGDNMDLRELKALEIAARARIVCTNGVWSVPSQTSPSTSYRVTIEPPSCECDDFQLRKAPCKHVIACRLVLERDGGEPAPAIVTDAVPKKPTYAQNWPVYSMAQRQEKNRFQVLLADLCSGVVEPERGSVVGRKPVPLADRIFSVVFKVWTTLSTRRFDCDLQDAVQKGYLSRTLHPNKINCFICEPELTPFLKALLVRSSLPLAAIESEFAVDSSGFSSSKFVRWYDHKYGVTKQEHTWVKAHIACGVNTHVVTAVAIYGRDANDCPILPELIEKTKENFKVDEVSADKAYLSVENVESVFAAGGIPFIAPKCNTTGGVGGLFQKMFHYYQFKREEFLKHYHKRSNVESTFSAVKRKFGDNVRSRNDTAMVNEVLCKLICNNLWCVILSQCELGIEPVFWQNEDRDHAPASILPMVRPGCNEIA